MKLLIKETFRILKGNFSSSLFVFLLQGIAALFLFAALFWALNFSSLKLRMQNKFEAKIFLNQDISVDKINQIRNFLSASKKVKKVTFISKREAKKIFSSRFADIEKDVLNQIELPPSFNLKFGGNVSYSGIMSFLKRVEKNSAVETVVFPHKVVFLFSKYFSIISFALIGILLILSVGIELIIKHLIERFVVKEREKLKIKYLIGAKKSTVVLPYYFSSILLCFVSTLFALVFVNLLLGAINRFFIINLLENKILFSNIIILFLSLYVGYLVAPKNLHFK